MLAGKLTEEPVCRPLAAALHLYANRVESSAAVVHLQRRRSKIRQGEDAASPPATRVVVLDVALHQLFDRKELDRPDAIGGGTAALVCGSHSSTGIFPAALSFEQFQTIARSRYNSSTVTASSKWTARCSSGSSAVAWGGRSIYTRRLRVYHTQMSSADLIRELKKAGWRLARVNGSHHVFTHPQHTGIVVVPHPKKDLGIGLVKAIRQQAGI